MTLSRMAGLWLLALPAPVAAGDAIDVYLDKTSVTPKCNAAVGSEIMVCGRRDADRYRVPLVSRPLRGDPKIVDVPTERARLIATETLCQQRGAHLIGCGMVGVTVSTKLGSGRIEYRPLAR